MIQRVLQLRVRQLQQTNKTNIHVHCFAEAERVFHHTAEAIISQQIAAVNAQHGAGIAHRILQSVQQSVVCPFHLEIEEGSVAVNNLPHLTLPTSRSGNDASCRPVIKEICRVTADKERIKSVCQRAIAGDVVGVQVVILNRRVQLHDKSAGIASGHCRPRSSGCDRVVQIEIGYLQVFVDCDSDCLAILKRAVTDANVKGIYAWALRFGRRPGKDASARVDTRARWYKTRCAVLQTISERLSRNIRVGRRSCKGKGHQFLNIEVSNRAQYRRDVDLINCDRDGFTVRKSAVADAHVKGVFAGALGFGRRPGEDAGRRVNRGSGRSANQAEREGLRGQVLVCCRGSEAQRRKFIDSLVPDVSQHRSIINIRHADDEVFFVAFAPGIGHFDANGVAGFGFIIKGNVRPQAAAGDIKILSIRVPHQVGKGVREARIPRVGVGRAQGSDHGVYGLVLRDACVTQSDICRRARPGIDNPVRIGERNCLRFGPVNEHAFGSVNRQRAGLIWQFCLDG